MLVILAIAAIAILACVVLVSLGRGGELTEFPPDVPPLDLPEPGQLTAVDFMALQLPVNLVGYHTASVDETLRRAANAISARDTRIAVLEQRVSELLSSRLHARQEIYAAPGAGLRTDHAPEAPAVARELPESGDPVEVSGATVSWDGTPDLRRAPEEPEWRIPPGDGEQAAPDDKAEAESPHSEATAPETTTPEATTAEEAAAVVKPSADEQPEEDPDEKPDETVKAETGEVAEPVGESKDGAEATPAAPQGKDGDRRP
ncbi:hypothetical protein ACFPOI_41345 [Nonomuraea angiospora]|uniref:DivIVA domain-containing protein n=1 Tax=Nonomuraea angiospora TaxID=46172 RepID=A0ABR9M3U9_9ACTN|nr:hypothetical protein [Nonomuraea angiospora]MBE1587559.1 hypothetical protein [Nonomuraea angiospora]